MKGASAEEITAEAFNQDVLDVDDTTWEQGLEQARAALSGKKG